MKRARSKYISRGLAYHLITKLFDSPLKQGYRNTFYCAQKVMLRDGKLISHYCKNRWCMVCNRIRTGQAINGYVPQLKKFQSPCFVTLTTRTISENGLNLRIEEMRRAWRLITDLALKKNKIDFKGVRSLECTSRPQGKYHPHYHLIVEGEENARWLVQQWLKHFQGRSNEVAQKIIKADDRSYGELFKYATKLSKMKGLISETKVAAEALDVIFRALKGKRLFQPFGGLKKASDDVEGELFGQDKPEGLIGEIWEWLKIDWFEIKSKEPLIGYSPSNRLKGLWKNGEDDIILPKKKSWLGQRNLVPRRRRGPMQKK